MQVDTIGVGSLSPTRATVLAAIQTRVTQRGRQPRVSPATAGATFERVGGHWLLSQVDLGGGTEVSRDLGGAGLAAASTAASSGVRDLTSYRRAHFTADYARALSHLTGALHRDVAARRAQTLAALDRGHYDLTTRIVGLAAVSADGATAVFLVTANGYRSTTPTSPVKQALRVTVRRVRDRWLLSQVTDVGVS